MRLAKNHRPIRTFGRVSKFFSLPLGALAFCLTLACFPCAAVAQTPWETAPAKPAQLPPDRELGSLPPPPKTNRYVKQPKIEDIPLYESISVPKHVPLRPKSQDVAKPRQNPALNKQPVNPLEKSLSPPAQQPQSTLSGPSAKSPLLTNSAAAQGPASFKSYQSKINTNPRSKLSTPSIAGNRLLNGMPYGAINQGANSVVPGTPSMASDSALPSGTQQLPNSLAPPTPAAAQQRVPPPPSETKVGTNQFRTAQATRQQPGSGLSMPLAHLPAPRASEPTTTTSPGPNSFANLPLPNLQQPASTTPSMPKTNSPNVYGAQTKTASSGTNLVQPTNFAVETNAAEDAIKEFKEGTLVAVVGADRILAGDLSRYVEPVVEANRSKLRSDSDEKRLREMVIRQVLQQYIEIKALYQEFFRDATSGSTPDKVIEMKKQVMTRAGKIFFEKQVPNMLKQHEVKDMQALEIKLREKSMSLTTMRSNFIEQVLANELERKYIPDSYEISRAELVSYYQKNKEKWEEPAMARWKQLTVRMDNHDYDRAKVEAKIKQLGNEIFLGGTSFEALAKRSSEGYTAEDGGVYDWTRKGSLKSKPLDEAIFALPLKKLSQVIEDDIGMHIIWVDERKPDRTKPFTEAQAEIRETLSDERRKKEIAEFRQKVLSRTPIWTLWPEDLEKKAKHARPLSEAIGTTQF